MDGQQLLCLFCCKSAEKTTEKRASSEPINDLTTNSDQEDSNETEVNVLKNRDWLNNFALRKLLEYPSKECENLLRGTSNLTTSNPANWFVTCDQCSELIGTAHQAYQQLLKCERKIKQVKANLEEKLKLSFQIKEEVVEDAVEENRKEMAHARWTIREYFKYHMDEVELENSRCRTPELEEPVSKKSKTTKIGIEDDPHDSTWIPPDDSEQSNDEDEDDDDEDIKLHGEPLMLKEMFISKPEKLAGGYQTKTEKYKRAQQGSPSTSPDDSKYSEVDDDLRCQSLDQEEMEIPNKLAEVGSRKRKRRDAIHRPSSLALGTTTRKRQETTEFEDRMSKTSTVTNHFEHNHVQDNTPNPIRSSLNDNKQRNSDDNPSHTPWDIDYITRVNGVVTIKRHSTSVSADEPIDITPKSVDHFENNDVQDNNALKHIRTAPNHNQSNGYDDADKDNPYHIAWDLEEIERLEHLSNLHQLYNQNKNRPTAEPPNKIRFSCPKCPACFSYKSMLNLHEFRSHTKFDVPEKFDMYPHGSTNSPIPPPGLEIAPPYRRKWGAKKKSVENPGGIPCNVCGESFTVPDIMLRHMRSHVNAKEKHCLVCLKPCCSSENQLTLHYLVNHQLVPETEKYYECEKCSFSLCSSDKNRKNLKDQHLQKHFIDDHWEEIRNEHDGRKTMIKCKHCGETIQEAGRNNGVAMEHLRTKHATQAGLQCFQCEHCEKTFSQKFYLKQHMNQIHLNVHKYQCNLCDKGYYKLTNLNAHLGTAHGQAEHSWVCDLCGLKLTLEKTLINHKKRFHSQGQEDMDEKGEGQPTGTQCKYCGLSVVHIVALKLHLKEAHKELFKYQCDLCDDGIYMKAQGLKHHKEAIHNQQASVKCPYCSREQKCASYLKRHLKRYCRVFRDMAVANTGGDGRPDEES